MVDSHVVNPSSPVVTPIANLNPQGVNFDSQGVNVYFQVMKCPHDDSLVSAGLVYHQQRWPSFDLHHSSVIDLVAAKSFAGSRSYKVADMTALERFTRWYEGRKVHRRTSGASWHRACILKSLNRCFDEKKMRKNDGFVSHGSLIHE
jgi:hypothetical protein